MRHEPSLFIHTAYGTGVIHEGISWFRFELQQPEHVILRRVGDNEAEAPAVKREGFPLNTADKVSEQVPNPAERFC